MKSHIYAGMSSSSSAFHLLKDQSKIYWTGTLFTRGMIHAHKFFVTAVWLKTINDSVCFANSSLASPKERIPCIKSEIKNPGEDNYSFKAAASAPEVRVCWCALSDFCIHSGRIVIQRLWKHLGGKTQLGCQGGACNKILSLCNGVTGLVIRQAHVELSLGADFNQGRPGKHDLPRERGCNTLPCWLDDCERTPWTSWCHMIHCTVSTVLD